MKSTGIIRNIDELGRIVIPKEMRRKLGINDNDPLEIFADGEQIVLVKYQDSCLFCGDCEELSSFKEKKICKRCKEEIAKSVL